MSVPHDTRGPQSVKQFAGAHDNALSLADTNPYIEDSDEEGECMKHNYNLYSHWIWYQVEVWPRWSAKLRDNSANIWQKTNDQRNQENEVYIQKQKKITAIRRKRSSIQKDSIIV